MGEGDTGVNALLGAVVTVLLGAWVPFAPVLGGGVAGYLQGGPRSDGLRVGAVFGLVFVAAYVVGLSVLGGWLGNYVRHDTSVDI